jgi:hypothetical protein
MPPLFTFQNRKAASCRRAPRRLRRTTQFKFPKRGTPQNPGSRGIAPKTRRNIRSVPALPSKVQPNEADITYTSPDLQEGFDKVAMERQDLTSSDQPLPAGESCAVAAQILDWLHHPTPPGGAEPALPVLTPCSSWLALRLPEPLLTTKFRDELRTHDADSERMDSILHRLTIGEIARATAEHEVEQVFSGDPLRSSRWYRTARNMHSFPRWLTGFEESYAYLAGSFPTRVRPLEELRARLLAICAEPQCLLDARERENFDASFAAFKREYVSAYCTAHEDTVQIVANREKMKARVDSVALRNLELLSDLNRTNRSFLNRTRALGKFLRAYQCDLSVREILARRPKCFCNFNPSGNRLLAMSVARMDEAIQEGIEHFRYILREGRKAIIQELGNLRADDPDARQIAALISRGAMIPLQQSSIDILNRIIQKHPDAFPHRLPRSPIILTKSVTQ